MSTKEMEEVRLEGKKVQAKMVSSNGRDLRFEFFLLGAGIWILE